MKNLMQRIPFTLTNGIGKNRSKRMAYCRLLTKTVQTIYGIFKDLEDHLFEKYPFLGKYLPEEIVFITSQELEDKYPELTPKDREHAIAKEHGAVFIIELVMHFVQVKSTTDAQLIMTIEIKR